MIKQKTASITAIALIVIGVAAAVTAGLFLFPYSPDSPPSADDSNSTQQGIQEVVNANNQFAFDLYKQLDEEQKQKEENKNVFYSPYSISTALAMTYEGAKGKTAEEMKEVFYFPENSILRPNSAAVYNNINKGDKNYELKTGNALWLQQDYPFLEDYLTRVEDYYGGKAANLDFISETEKSRQTINIFIEEQTNNRIKDLIPQGVLKPDTRLVLTNAIYFKGTWEWEFDKSDTREQDFKISEDNVIKTEMMFMEPEKTNFNYAQTEKLQILELPYKDNEVSMLILLPRQGEEYDYQTGESITFNYNLEDIELTSEKLSEYKNQMKETKLDSISLPKFEFDSKYFMKDTLTALGMPTAFKDPALSGLDGADFSGMTAERELFISAVIHQAFVKVDEQGTEAAAATAVVKGLTSAMPRNVFQADHPFVFIIQEKETGNILFMGKVVNPSE